MSGLAQPRWGFLTFGAGLPSWRAAAQRLGREAVASGQFTRVSVVTDRTLFQEYPRFASTHQEILKLSVRGYGYWIWKPFLIREHLLRWASEVDGLLYLDAGFHLNLAGSAIARWREYQDITLSGQGVFGMHLPGHPERQWTKPSVIDALGLSQLAADQPQIQATPMFAAGSTQVDWVDDWLSILVRDNYTAARDPGPRDSLPSDFMAHRHDQSVFSCMLKRDGIGTIPDETYWHPDWQSGGRQYPLWAVRNRTRVPFGAHGPWISTVRVSEKLYSRILMRSWQHVQLRRDTIHRPQKHGEPP